MSHTTKHSAFKDIPRFSHSTVLPFDRFLFFFNIYWLIIEVVSRSKLENRSMGLLINFRTRLFRLIHSFKSRPFFLINMLVLRVTQYQHVTVTVTRRVTACRVTVFPSEGRTSIHTVSRNLIKVISAAKLSFMTMSCFSQEESKWRVLIHPLESFDTALLKIHSARWNFENKLVLEATSQN